MFAMRSFDTFNEAIRASSYAEAKVDREQLARASSDLVKLYEGNGKVYVERYIDAHFKDPVLKEAFHKLARCQNSTALVVNQVATTGLVRIVWKNRETGELDRRAQSNWDRLLNDWCSNDWDAFTQTTNQRTKLLRAVVATWAWDTRRRRMVLRHYGPHEMDVEYEPGNFDKLNPDRYVFLREEATGWEEVWEFSDAASKYKNGKDGIVIEEAAFPVRDQVRDETVVPFVRFATVGSGADYWVWDGQGDQIDAHENVDICWTAANVLREYGLVVVPLLMGEGWEDEDGRIKPLIFDLLRPVKQPSQALGGDSGKPLLQFVTPDVGPLIDRCLGMASAQIEMTSARYGVSARAVLSKGEAASGYALQIDGASQRRQHLADVARDARPWARVADGMRWYWNHHLGEEKSWDIPASVYPVAILPKSHAVVPTRESVDSQLAMVNAGLLQPIGVIYDAEPGIDAAKAFDMAEDVEERVTAGTNMLDSNGTAGARAPQPNRIQQTRKNEPPSDTDDDGAPEPVVPAGSGAAVTGRGDAS